MATKATSPPKPTGLVRGCHPHPDPQRRARPKPPCETTDERAPEFRAFAQGAEVGAASWNTGMGNNGALPRTLADISFGEAFGCALVIIDGAHSLVSSRSTAKAD